jgi:(1->4)-alpha-D-glucan 1-alpha-D-glucosylmutase
MQIPASTYRIQLHEHFTFSDLETILGYLHELGIGAIYASPVTTAFKGSQHGYDVTDPLHLNPEIGTREQLERLAASLRQYGMTWLQDIVPNHMAYDSSNPWLCDVLERGRHSDYYRFFDINEKPVGLLGDKLMAPFLGKTLTECVQQKELTLQLTQRGLVIRYYDKDYPVADDLYTWIATVADGCPPKLVSALEELAQACGQRIEGWTAAKEKWLRLVAADAEWTSFLTKRITFINERQNLVETLVEGQHYILTHAHLAATHINYRRFFTVNSLICLRMEDEAVFRAWHEQLHRWYTAGLIQGLRIDHIDGLAAPATYIDRLRKLFGPDCYIIAEKILARDESMSEDWSLEGMTGYEFLAAAGQVLTDADGSRQLLEFYKEQIITLPEYEQLVFERKYDFLRRYMGGELDNLLGLLAEQDTGRLKEALAVLMSSFPVYRSYPGEGPLSAADRKIIGTAFARAKQRLPDAQAELGFLEGCLDEDRAFRSRLMQFTGPLAAKGIEDTTFYVYNPYIAHNEVGDTPAIAGITTGDFHRKMQDRLATLPHSLNATTTHDTKRGEDSRIRLNLLSRKPQEWINAVTHWREVNKGLIADVNGRPAPSPNDEYLIYQALLGGLPEDGVITDDFRERFAGYLTKALREAKAETNYDHPDEGYEQQCQSFATAILQPDAPFMESFIPFAGSIIRESFPYSLAQLLIKLTAPGVPDIYQGAELWETSLVDPDNRRPVDFAVRAGLLQQIKAASAKGNAVVLDFVLAHPENGAIKLFTLYRALAYRSAQPEVFASGDYIPVAVQGSMLAYIRHYEKDWVLILVPLIGGGNGPSDVTDSGLSLTLPPEAPSAWTNIFTGDICQASGQVLEWKDSLGRFPVVLLTARSS